MTTQHDEIQSSNAAHQQDTQQIQELPLQKFYDTELLEIPARTRKLLEGYSKIASEDILPHILQVVGAEPSLGTTANATLERSCLENRMMDAYTTRLLMINSTHILQ
jgi:hypothetical protein